MFNINKFKKEIEGIKQLRNTHSTLSMEKKLEIKRNILNAIAIQSLESSSTSFWHKYKHKSLQYLLVVFLGITIFGGTAYASSKALPGEILYPVKRVAEKLQLNVVVSEETKTTLQAKFAEKRLKELEEIQKQKKLDILEDDSKLSTTTQAVITSTTTIQSTKSELKIKAIKFKESKVEKEAKKEAETEVKEALVNLRKLQRKMSEEGKVARAKALGDNIIELKVKALEKDIKEEDDKVEFKEDDKFHEEDSNKTRTKLELNLFKKH